jgi:hypothetical protein
MKTGCRRTALSRVWHCELHPGDGLEVRRFGRTRFLPNWQPAPIKAPAFLPWGSRFAGDSPVEEGGFEPSVPRDRGDDFRYEFGDIIIGAGRSFFQLSGIEPLARVSIGWRSIRTGSCSTFQTWESGSAEGRRRHPWDVRNVAERRPDFEFSRRTLLGLDDVAGPAGFTREGMTRRNIVVLRLRPQGSCGQSGCGSYGRIWNLPDEGVAALSNRGDPATRSSIQIFNRMIGLLQNRRPAFPESRPQALEA